MRALFLWITSACAASQATDGPRNHPPGDARSNQEETATTGERPLGEGRADASVEFTAPQDGVYVFDTTGSNFHAGLYTVAELYKGPGVSNPEIDVSRPGTTVKRYSGPSTGFGDKPKRETVYGAHLVLTPKADEKVLLIVDGDPRGVEPPQEFDPEGDFILNVALVEEAESNCVDGRDLDDDGDYDCRDSDCLEDEACTARLYLRDTCDGAEFQCGPRFTHAQSISNVRQISHEMKRGESVIAVVDGDSLTPTQGTYVLHITQAEETEQDCTDGFSVDGDHLVDCEDRDCASRAPCAEVACGDGIDGDGDGDLDCRDVDCAFDVSAVRRAAMASTMTETWRSTAMTGSAGTTLSAARRSSQPPRQRSGLVVAPTCRIVAMHRAPWLGAVGPGARYGFDGHATRSF